MNGAELSSYGNKLKPKVESYSCPLLINKLEGDKVWTISKKKW